MAEEIKNFGGEILIVTADVKKQKDVEHVAQQAVNKWGRIDTWVQVAGTNRI